MSPKFPVAICRVTSLLYVGAYYFGVLIIIIIIGIETTEKWYTHTHTHTHVKSSV
jgi:hypothetical protein